MTILKQLSEQETGPPRDPAEMLAEMAEDETLPLLTRGAVKYLAQYDGNCQRLTVGAQEIAADYGSLKTHRLHAVMAAQRLGL